jgi:hypothetical protein
MLAYVSFHIDVMECGNSLSMYENIPLRCCLRRDVGHKATETAVANLLVVDDSST